LTKLHLDHAAFRRNRLNAENVIDSKKVERALREKPVSTFSHRALAPGRYRSRPQFFRRRLVTWKRGVFALREPAGVSQGVFARVLNVRPKLVSE